MLLELNEVGPLRPIIIEHPADKATEQFGVVLPNQLQLFLYLLVVDLVQRIVVAVIGGFEHCSVQ